ncbi:DUF4145 domain-containing protein [Ningiella sp. W23]|uniref:DUF4145 domain-containing protein n=1 Tax=Ningiella sp. W23 TaxID=3023715 RepID=UPI0037575CAE
MKIKDNRDEFVSLTANKEIWDDVLNNSVRGAVLSAAAAFEVSLERLLKSFLVQGVSSSKNIAEKSNFSHKINLCFSLGLITEKEKDDLNTLREIRNAFAHNIFGCDFKNSEVQKFVRALKLPLSINFPRDNIRNFFNIGMIMLDTSLSDRLKRITPINQRPNLVYSHGA